MGAFFRELLRAGIYKRNQGRITRQVTFAALAVAIALGLWRLSFILQRYDPIVQARPAMATCTPKTDRLATEGTIRVTGTADADVAFRKGESLTDIVGAVNRLQRTTGVVADLREGEEGEQELVLMSKAPGAEGVLKVEAPAGVFNIVGLDADGIARGGDALNLGLRFLIPGFLLAAGLWACYRVVNMPAFADFLIAVEAEMNKVSWPTRPELFRASMVVLILIFSLAFILAGYDILWRLFFTHVLHIL